MKNENIVIELKDCELHTIMAQMDCGDCDCRKDCDNPYSLPTYGPSNSCTVRG